MRSWHLHIPRSKLDTKSLKESFTKNQPQKNEKMNVLNKAESTARSKTTRINQVITTWKRLLATWNSTWRLRGLNKKEGPLNDNVSNILFDQRLGKGASEAKIPEGRFDDALLIKPNPRPHTYGGWINVPTVNTISNCILHFLWSCLFLHDDASPTPGGNTK